MAPPSEPSIDTEELMARVRATLSPSDATQDAAAAPVVLSPHFHQEQLLLDQAQRVVSIGATVPPFGGLHPLLRPFARFTTKTLYFLLQVITVDQRVFNGLLLNVTRMTSAGLAQGEAALNERMNQWKAVLTGRDRQIEALESTVAELHASIADREQRLAALEQKLHEVHTTLTERHAALTEEHAALTEAHAALAKGHAALTQGHATLTQGNATLTQGNAALTEGHTALTERHAATAQGVAGAQASLAEQNGRLAALEAGAALAERALSEASQRTKETLGASEVVLAELRKRVAAAQTSVAAQERRLVQLGNVAASSQGAGKRDATQQRTLANEAAHALDALYVNFEEEFRGSEEDIKNRLRVYIPDVQAVLGESSGQVVDLGCGRGEWLALLREHGIAGRGVDTNRVQIERCRSEGLEVVDGDAIGVLSTLADASIDVVTAFHLVEHLEYPTVVELLDQVVRVLRPGGLFILETPNPDNLLVGGCQFYLDPTHHSPLPSPLAKFLVEARGLHDVEVRPLHPSPDYEHLNGSEIAERLNRHFYGPRDYAILGYKA